MLVKNEVKNRILDFSESVQHHQHPDTHESKKVLKRMFQGTTIKASLRRSKARKSTFFVKHQLAETTQWKTENERFTTHAQKHTLYSRGGENRIP